MKKEKIKRKPRRRPRAQGQYPDQLRKMLLKRVDKRLAMLTRKALRYANSLPEDDPRAMAIYFAVL